MVHMSVKKHAFKKNPPSSACLVRAVANVLKRELGDEELARLQPMFDSELKQQVFSPGAAPPPPWSPPKPCLSRLVLEALISQDLLPDGKPVALAGPVIGAATLNLKLSKVVARRAIESVIANKREELKSSGELKADLFEDDAKLYASISRIGADVLGCAGKRAIDAVQGDAVVELQDASQLLGGRDTRGFGLVVCQKGMAVFEGVVRELLQETTDPAEVE